MRGTTTDHASGFADQVRAFVLMPFTVLGTDGSGRPDAHAAIAVLAKKGEMTDKDVAWLSSGARLMWGMAIRLGFEIFEAELQRTKGCR